MISITDLEKAIIQKKQFRLKQFEERVEQLQKIKGKIK